MYAYAYSYSHSYSYLFRVVTIFLAETSLAFCFVTQRFVLRHFFSCFDRHFGLAPFHFFIFAFESRLELFELTSMRHFEQLD